MKGWDGFKAYWPHFLLLLILICLLLWGWKNVGPWTGSTDLMPVSARDLAEFTLDSIKYTQALVTAVFGAAIAVFSGNLLGARGNEVAIRRRLVLAALMVLLFSLVAGFISIEMVIMAADERLLDSKRSELSVFRILQMAFFFVGSSLLVLSVARK